MTAVAMSRALSRISSQLDCDSPDDVTSCVKTLVTGLLQCLQRLDDARSSAVGDVQVMEQLTSDMTAACRHLLRQTVNVKDDVIDTRLVANLSQTNVTDVTHELEAMLNDNDNDDDDDDSRSDNRTID